MSYGSRGCGFTLSMCPNSAAKWTHPISKLLESDTPNTFRYFSLNRHRATTKLIEPHQNTFSPCYHYCSAEIQPCRNSLSHDAGSFCQLGNITSASLCMKNHFVSLVLHTYKYMCTVLYCYCHWRRYIDCYLITSGGFSHNMHSRVNCGDICNCSCRRCWRRALENKFNKYCSWGRAKRGQNFDCPLPT